MKSIHISSFQIILSVILISCTSSTSDLDYALKLSEGNRMELEKVLAYYGKNEKDSLKLRAAEYLISNMVYQYSVSGPAVDSLNSIYKQVYGNNPIERHEIFYSDSLQNRIVNHKKITYDIQNISHQFLINQIELAFKNYKKFEWNKAYSFKIFCEHILPYKISNAKVSDWRSHAYNNFYSRINKMFYPFMTIDLETDLYNINHSSNPNLFNSKTSKYSFSKNGNKFEKFFKISDPGAYMFSLIYTNPKLNGAEVIINIDGIRIQKFILPSTNINGKFMINNSTNFLSNLNSGKHVISMTTLDNEILIHKILVNKKMNHNNLYIPDGQYYIKNTNGWISLKDEMLGSFKLTNDKSKASIFNIFSQDLSYQFKLDTSESHVLQPLEDLSNNRIGLFDNLESLNQKWFLLPHKNGKFQVINRSTNKYLDSSEKNIIIQSNVTSERTFWNFRLIKSNFSHDTLSSLKKIAIRIRDETDTFHWFGDGDIGPVSPIHILDYCYGTCVEEVQRQTMLLRAMGIACTSDYVLNWGDRASRHFWSVIFDGSGEALQNNSHNPVGERLDWIEGNKKGKVYRKSNTINNQSLFVTNKNFENVPSILNDPYMKDVTEEYCKTHNIAINIDYSGIKNTKFGYILVYDNQNWVPIGWGKRNKNEIRFKDFEENVLYLPAIYDGYNFISVNKPFYIDTLGSVHQIFPNNTSTESVSLKRKYPNYTGAEWLDDKIIGGVFQGSNKADFTDAVNLGIIKKNMTDPIYQTVYTNNNKKFKYFRYIGPPGSHCNISEIILIDNKNKKLDGELIGGSKDYNNFNNSIKMAFDGDVLTYSDLPKETNAWLGLSFDKAEVIQKIRFIGRNDGNMVEIGDNYELWLWGEQDWMVLDRKEATSDSLIFNNIPSQGLFILHNSTKGTEERPFTIIRGKPVWW